MSAKYSKVPSRDPDDAVQLDFSSAFSYGSLIPPNQQQYLGGAHGSRYKSAFTYSGDGLHTLQDDIAPSCLTKICSLVVTWLCYLFLFITFPVSCWFSIKILQQYERLVVFRLGRMVGTKGPGLTLKIPFIDRCHLVDLRMKAFNVPPQNAFTSDNGILEIGASIYFRICDPARSVNSLQDQNHALRVLGHTVLLRQVAKYELSEVETHKEFININALEDLNKTSKLWGVEIARVEISHPKIIAMPQPANPLGKLGGGSGQSMLSPLMNFMGMGNAGGATPLPSQTTYPLLPVNAQGQVVRPQAFQYHQPGLEPLPEPQRLTPQQLLDAIRPHLNESMVQSFGAVYKFELEGENGGVYYLDLKNGSGSAGRGEPPNGPADTILNLHDDDMNDLFTGNLKAFNAYLGGKLRISGDLNAAMDLEKLIDKLKLS